MERRQREAQARLNEISREHAEMVRQRDEAAVAGNEADMTFYDDEAMRLEQEYAQLNPAPPPGSQLSERSMEWINRHKSYFERHGQNALSACAKLHDYALSRGYQEGSEAYVDFMESGLALYGGDLGARFDGGECLPTPDDIAKDCGLTAKEYNRAAKKMYDSGHNSDALYNNMWKRNAG
jgi:hypothetical protein